MTEGGCQECVITDAEQRWLSTGEAAKLCSVERDTVLKWIKRGRLSATRTAGGHYRIDFQDLQRIASRFSNPDEDSPPLTGLPLRCWEYLSAGDGVREECQHCMAYRVGAAWCFLLREMQAENGVSFCSGPESCEDCSYYRRVKGLATRVLVVTADEALHQSLRGENKEDLAFCFARTGYEAATAIARFRPGFAVVDAEVDRGGGAELVENLASDPRNHGLKIVLAMSPRPARRTEASGQPRAVVEVVKKPFGPAELRAVVEKFPVEYRDQTFSLPSIPPAVSPAEADRKSNDEDGPI